MKDQIESPPPPPAVKVSVLMPVYNTKEIYLREAIESILGQTYHDFELLIINDASTDPNVKRVVESYEDPRIRHFSNAENMGISGVRNKLISLSRGEYLAVMDHDDISLPERFAKEVAYLDAHPEVGVIGCQCKWLQNESRQSDYPFEDEDIRIAMVSSCVILHPACMIRKSVLVETGIRYESAFSPAEDYALFYRLMGATKFCNLEDVLFHYRWHGENTSKRQRRKMIIAKATIQEMARQRYPDLFEKLQRVGQHITRIKLFGFLPILKIIRESKDSKSLLFHHIPVYKTTRHGEKCKHYIFGVIPICTIKREVYLKYSRSAPPETKTTEKS